VRDLVLDALDPGQLAGLAEATEQILQRVDPGQTTRPPWSLTTTAVR